MRDYAAAAGRAAMVIALGLTPLLIHAALSLDLTGHIAARSPMAGRLVTAGLVAATGLPHLVAYVGLLTTFALTLRSGREPLVTWLARRLSGGILSGEMVAYTRGVTRAWCVFFAAQISTSLALFAVAPLGVWSFFVNVLNLPLLALMFAAELLCRRIYLREPPHHTVADIMRALGYFGGPPPRRRGAG